MKINDLQSMYTLLTHLRVQMLQLLENWQQGHNVVWVEDMAQRDAY